MTNKKKKTATGMSINELALKLMKQDQTLSFEDSKEKAKAQIKAKKAINAKREGLREELEYGLGGKTKHKVLGKLFGERVGGFLSNKIRSKSHEEDIAQRLIEGSSDKEELVKKLEAKKASEDSSPPQAPVEKKTEQFIAPSEIKAISTKLTSIEASVKAIKTIKVADPAKSKPEPLLKTQAHEDASLGLKALGYKKKEIDDMMKDAKGTTSQELIKSALKPKNKIKIPTEHVPAAIETAKTEINTTPMSEPQSTRPGPVTTVIKERDVAPGPTPTPTLEPASKVASVVPKSTDEPVPDVQKESTETKKEEEHKDEVKKDEKEKNIIIKKLDEILEHVKGGGFLSTISKFFGPLLTMVPLIGTALAAIAPLLGGLVAVAAAAYAGYKIGKWLNDKLDISGKIVNAISPEYKTGGGAEGTAKALAGINKRLEGTGYTAIGNQQFKDSTGAVVKYNELPKDIQIKAIPGVANATAPGPSPIAKADIAAPMAQSTAAAKIDAVSTDNSNMKSGGSPIVQQIDARKTVNMPSKGGGSSGSSIVAINARNMEPSISGYMASIFSHPVIRLPL